MMNRFFLVGVVKSRMLSLILHDVSHLGRNTIISLVGFLVINWTPVVVGNVLIGCFKDKLPTNLFDEVAVLRLMMSL